MIGLVTIGQAPREDVVHSMFGSGRGDDYPQAGALDQLDRAQIAKLAPRDGEHPLVTRLRDGTEVVIAKERLTELMNEAIAKVEDAGATVTCVLCTGEFNGLLSRSRLVYPDRLLAGVVDALGTDGVLGVMIPNDGQRDGMLRKWSRSGRKVELSVVSPYSGSSGVRSATLTLIDGGAQMIVLDCMGYTEQMLRDAQSSCAVPVVLANRLVGSVLDAVMPGLPHPLQQAGTR